MLISLKRVNDEIEFVDSEFVYSDNGTNYGEKESGEISDSFLPGNLTLRISLTGKRKGLSEDQKR